MQTLTTSHIKTLKREASKLKKQKLIPHVRALDEIAVAQGYRHWTDLLAHVGQESSEQVDPQASLPERVVGAASRSSSLFHNWLIAQDWRPDPVGEFARQVAADRSFPVATDALDSLKQYLQARNARPAELESLEEAWEDFLAFLRT
jgi:uncharacterized protein YozE (UPF0346 family)